MIKYQGVNMDFIFYNYPPDPSPQSSTKSHTWWYSTQRWLRQEKRELWSRPWDSTRKVRESNPVRVYTLSLNCP